MISLIQYEFQVEWKIEKWVYCTHLEGRNLFHGWKKFKI